MSAQEYP